MNSEPSQRPDELEVMKRLEASGSFLVGVMFWWWVSRTLAALGVVQGWPAWAGIGVLCYLVSLGSVMALMCIIWPVRAVTTRPAGRECWEPVAMIVTFGSLLIYVTPQISTWPVISACVLILPILACIRCQNARIPAVKPPPVSLSPSSGAHALDWPAAPQARWDIFLSYRAAPDSNQVRRLAESLVRQGYKPWFAEFEISPHEWDQPEVIAQRLREGVASSKRFLVITNEAWTESSWCNEEMRAMLNHAQRLKAQGAITSLAEILAEVCLPPSTAPRLKFPELSGVKSCVIQDDILEAWAFLERDLKWLTRQRDDSQLLATARMMEISPEGTVPGGLSFSLGGLEAVEDIFDPAFKAKGWEFNSYRGQWMGRDVKLRVLINPYRNRLEVLAGVPGKSDDRAIHRQLVANFSGFSREDSRIQSVGTHLVLMDDGHSGLGVSAVVVHSETKEPQTLRTYVTPLHPARKCRRCGRQLLFIASPGNDRPQEVLAACENPQCDCAEFWPKWEQDSVGEAEYSFTFENDRSTPDASRELLSQFAPLMEAVVLSARRTWYAPLLEWQAVAFRGLMLIVTLEGYRYCRIALTPSWYQAAWLAGTGFVSAELLFAIGLPSLRRQVMRGCFGSKMWLPLGTWFPRIWNITKGAVGQSLLMLLGGLWPFGLLLCWVISRVQPEQHWMAAALGAATAISGLSRRPWFETGQRTEQEAP